MDLIENTHGGFVVSETIVSNPNIPLPDPEFDIVDFRVTWQDKQENLWVAPVDPITGNFLLDEARLIDTGLAPIPSYRLRTGTGNGPEWIYSEEGSQIVYTRLVNGKPFIATTIGEGLDLTPQLLSTGNDLPKGSRGLSPLGSLDPDDDSPLVLYVLPSPVGEDGFLAVRDYDEPIGGRIPLEALSFGRWVNGKSETIILTALVDGLPQVVNYDVLRNTITQLTANDSNSRYVKGETFMWEAPDFDNELIFFAGEGENSQGENPEELVIYRQIAGVWTEINRLKPPSDKKFIRSVEPFVYNGQSYLSMILEDKKTQPSEIWIAGIDPEVEFYRQVSNPDVEMVRNDPEVLVTESGAFVYYAQRGAGVIYRADTGLGIPDQRQDNQEQDNRDNDSDAGEISIDETSDSGNDGDNPLENDSDLPTSDPSTNETTFTYDTDNGLFKLAGGDETVAIEFHLDSYQGRVVSEIGLFLVDDTQGRIGEILPDEPGYLEAALSRGKVIFSALAANVFPHLHNNHSINLNSDNLVVFYLIERSSTDQVLADIKTGNNPNSVQFVFNSSAKNSQENLQVTQLSEGSFSLTWQDFVLSASLDTSGDTSLGVGLQGDRQRELIDLRDLTSQFITAEFTVDSKAQYKNRGGLYLVTDELGTVVDADTGDFITPGESGYTEAALRSSVAEFSEPGTFQEILLGGFFYAPYLIANDEEVYFPFLDANSDNLDHLQLLGNHSFAFEDLQGGGDFSYDDFVFQVNLDLFSG